MVCESGSRNTVAASSNDTACLARLESAFSRFHSKRSLTGLRYSHRRHYSRQASSVKHQRARAEVSRMKDELSVRELSRKSPVSY